MQWIVVACIIGAVFASPHKGGHHKPRDKFEEEIIELDVRKSDGNGQVQQVSLRVHILDGFVHINGHKVFHEAVTAIHLRTRLTCHGKARPARVHVRVMVEEMQKANGLRALVVQEEILEVDGKSVTQIDVKEVELHMKDGKKESHREVSVISLQKSKIHSKDRLKDKPLYFDKDGVLPDVPLKASKHDMEMFHKVPKAKVGPPHLPDSPLTGDPEDDDEREGKKHHRHHHRHHGKHHGKHHHGHDKFKKWKRGFCHWFHRLPLAARVAIFVSVLIVGVGFLGCCVKCLCCSKPANPEGQRVEETEEEKKEAVDDFDVVGPLPQKKPIDEMQLIA